MQFVSWIINTLFLSKIEQRRKNQFKICSTFLVTTIVFNIQYCVDEHSILCVNFVFDLFIVMTVIHLNSLRSETTQNPVAVWHSRNMDFTMNFLKIHIDVCDYCGIIYVWNTYRNNWTFFHLSVLCITKKRKNNLIFFLIIFFSTNFYFIGEVKFSILSISYSICTNKKCHTWWWYYYCCFAIS